MSLSIPVDILETEIDRFFTRKTTNVGRSITVGARNSYGVPIGKRSLNMAAHKVGITSKNNAR